jgi:DNA polymerase-3 subunit beta
VTVREGTIMLKAHLPQEELHRYLQIVSRGVSGRSTQPIQNNVYLEAGQATLRMIASDLEYIHIEGETPALVDEEGAVTVPARLLVEVTGSLAHSEVTLEAGENNTLVVSCARSRYEIRGLPAMDFEMLPPVDGAVTARLSQKLLHRILRQTVFAVSRDETRPILTGVQFALAPGKLEVVGTDLYRLAKCVITAESVPEVPEVEVEQQEQAIISARCLHEVQRLLNEESEDRVELRLSKNLVQFTVGPIRVVSRLIEGRFPSYERAVPDHYDKLVLCRREDLSVALRRALIVARDDANRVVFRTGGEVMTLSAESPEVGKAEEEVEVEVEGEDIEIAFNARYVLDVLEAIDSERVQFELTGSFNAGIIRPEGDQSYFYVLMPMQILPGTS